MVASIMLKAFRPAVPANVCPVSLRQQASTSACMATPAISYRQTVRTPRPVACQSVNVEREVTKKRAWERAAAMLSTGEVFETPVKNINKGGIVVDCWGTNGFIPKSMLWDAMKVEEGQTIRVVFKEVDPTSNRLILSQKQVFEAELLKQLKAGDLVKCAVTWIEPYGAFVDLKVGETGSSVTGLIRTTELSWKKIMTPDAAVSVGDQVKCVVLDVDRVKGKINLSLKQTKPDPLKQNVETIIPFDSNTEMAWESKAATPASSIVDLINKLKAQDGITEVRMGRQATVPGVVSQDLELWLTKEPVDGHFNVIGRAGSDALELAVYCTLTRDEMKATIDRVLRM